MREYAHRSERVRVKVCTIFLFSLEGNFCFSCCMRNRRRSHVIAMAFVDKKGLTFAVPFIYLFIIIVMIIIIYFYKLTFAVLGRQHNTTKSGNHTSVLTHFHPTDQKPPPGQAPDNWPSHCTDMAKFGTVRGLWCK